MRYEIISRGFRECTNKMKQLAQQAVSFALKGNWEKALKVNKAILKQNPSDIDALNRLARAYAELGDMKQARVTARKTIKIDPYNSIAKKCLAKWKALKKGETFTSSPSSANAFLEEPGKTKLVSLLHLGSKKILAKLDAGDEVNINTHAHRVSIVTAGGDYIGKLTDDLSARLRKLIKYGNEYKAFIKSVDTQEVKIFLREVKRSPKLADIPSFSAEKIDYISFTSPELVHKKSDVSGTEDEEE